ncbi:neuromedin Ba [Solea solea]|uniref:neuromedin Ba n=1 Tax=Solea solea TaxID=90069 RepID=UPI00272C2EE2|nr:neuromedin Ba [Solea solea]
MAEASSMTLNLRGLRSKVSKIKMNQRTKLWATGHFMGEKSVVEGSSMEFDFEDVNVPAEFRAVLLRVKDLQTRLTHKLPCKYEEMHH